MSIKLYSHQKQVLKETKDFNKVAFYLDMGLWQDLRWIRKVKRIKCPLQSSDCAKIKNRRLEGAF